MSLIENLKWRYATKLFDNTKKINKAGLETLKESIQLSASSYGLQLYKVLIIEDHMIKKQLLPATYGQKQIVDASHVFVFCNYTNVKDSHIDEHLQLKADLQGLNFDDLKGYGDFMKQTLSYKSEVEMNNWTSKQTYLALGNLLVAAAELRIDICPMEGFEAEKYNDILGLNAQGLNVSVIAAAGYRSEDDKTQFGAKVRRPSEELFELV